MRCFGQPVIFHVTHARMSHGLLTITSTASGLYLMTYDNRTHTLTSPIGPIVAGVNGQCGLGNRDCEGGDNNINNFNSQSLECNVRRVTRDHKCTRRAVKTCHWLNSQVLRSRRNVTAGNLGWRRLTGRLFQAVGPALANARGWGEGRRGLGLGREKEEKGIQHVIARPGGHMGCRCLITNTNITSGV